MENNKTIFTDAEKQHIMDTIDWIVTEYSDWVVEGGSDSDVENLPSDISEWIALLCINNVYDSTIYKIVKRTQATDDSVRVCVQEYLDDSVTQVYNTCEQNLRIKNSIR